MKSEEVKSKIDKSLSKLVDFGWGIGIRTPTNRVRVCRATVTQFPNILLTTTIIFFKVRFVKSYFARFFKKYLKY